MKNKAAIVLLTAIAIATAHASEEHEKLEIYKLETIEVIGAKQAADGMRFELHSTPNESLESFLDRSWPKLREYMKQAGLDSCLVVGRDDDGRFFSYIEPSHVAVALCGPHAAHEGKATPKFQSHLRAVTRADVQAAEKFLGRMLHGRDIAEYLGEPKRQRNEELSIRVRDKVFPATRLDEVHGGAEISENEFATMVASGLADYTANTGTEACAMFCRKLDGSWAAIPLSIGSHVTCPITNYCPEGSVPTGVGIHSHPTEYQFNINDADKVVLAGPFYKIGKKEKHGKPNEFSEEDYDSGPGYMVTAAKNLFHQEGRHKVKRLGRVK